MCVCLYLAPLVWMVMYKEHKIEKVPALKSLQSDALTKASAHFQHTSASIKADPSACPFIWTQKCNTSSSSCETQSVKCLPLTLPVTGYREKEERTKTK